ncbi:MAG: hypothetical protein Q9163_003761 [Psora crenata]
MPPSPPQNESHFYGRGLNFAIASIVFTTVAVLLVASRLAVRAHIGSRLGLSDYAIILSTLFSIGLTLSNMGLEKSQKPSVAMICVSPYKCAAPFIVHNVLTLTIFQAFFVSQIIYKFTINLTKTSICLLYLQIFPGVKLRRITYIVMTYVLLYATASIIGTVVQCSPIARMWDSEIPGTCINLTAFWYANAAANILGDCIILVLPIRSTMALAIPQRQKYGLIVVFTLGAL